MFWFKHFKERTENTIRIIILEMNIINKDILLLPEKYGGSCKTDSIIK